MNKKERKVEYGWTSVVGTNVSDPHDDLFLAKRFPLAGGEMEELLLVIERGLSSAKDS